MVLLELSRAAGSTTPASCRYSNIRTTGILWRTSSPHFKLKPVTFVKVRGGGGVHVRLFRSLLGELAVFVDLRGP